MRFRVTFEGTIVDDDGTLLPPDDLDALLDQVGDELAKLPDGKDADVGATLTHGRVEIAVSVDTLSTSEDAAYGDAANKGGAIIRSALHAARVATPGWSLGDLRIIIEADTQPTEAKELVDA